jgi:hypothetical protein
MAPVRLTVEIGADEDAHPGPCTRDAREDGTLTPNWPFTAPPRPTADGWSANEDGRERSLANDEDVLPGRIHLIAARHAPRIDRRRSRADRTTKINVRTGTST